jgi:hypothetical protein
MIRLGLERIVGRSDGQLRVYGPRQPRRGGKGCRLLTVCLAGREQPDPAEIERCGRRLPGSCLSVFVVFAITLGVGKAAGPLPERLEQQRS